MTKNWQKDALASFNERIKLTANTLNATGIGLIGFAILRPVTESLNNVTWAFAAWGSVGLAMHVVSHYVLKEIRKEAKNDVV